MDIDSPILQIFYYYYSKLSELKNNFGSKYSAGWYGCKMNPVSHRLVWRVFLIWSNFSLYNWSVEYVRAFQAIVCSHWHSCWKVILRVVIRAMLNKSVCVTSMLWILHPMLDLRFGFRSFIWKLFAFRWRSWKFCFEQESIFANDNCKLCKWNVMSCSNPILGKSFVCSYAKIKLYKIKNVAQNLNEI